ncbi:MAG TPA: alpha/beta hydrolase, partial [Xanthomonadales bacterium]|nr:alpha/beta hydrolase [Xanthomonadales bacterium]
ALGRGNFGAFEQRFAASNSAQFAEGLYLSVTCIEDAPLITESRGREAARGTFLGSYRVDEQLGACRAWNVPPAPLRYGSRKHDVPVLMVAGDRDYVTPVAWAERAITAFPRGRLVVVPKLGHMPDGLANAECFDDLMGRFFEKPDAAALDVSCVAGMTPPPFEKRAAVER